MKQVPKHTKTPCWLFVDSSSQLGGHQIMLLRWLEELQQQQRVDGILMARQGSTLVSRAQQRTQRIATLPASVSAASRFGAFWAKLRLPIRALHDALRLCIVVARYRPALCISVEGCLLAQVWLTCVMRLLGQRTWVYVPLVEPSTQMGFGRGRLRDRLMRYFYAHVPHGWITLTQEQARQFIGWSGASTPVLDLPNTVSTQIEAAGKPIQRRPPHQPIKVLVLGRFDAHQKGLDLLLDFLDGTEKLPNMTVTVAGKGPYGEVMQQRLACSAKLQSLLTIEPWSETLDALNRHDLLLLPSRYEGVPLVMLEAMAIGVPVVATDLPGTRAFLDKSCLFSPGNLAQAMQLVSEMANTNRRADTIKRNYNVFMNQASGQAFGAAVKSLTDTLLDTSAHAKSGDAATQSCLLTAPHDGN